MGRRELKRQRERKRKRKENGSREGINSCENTQSKRGRAKKKRPNTPKLVGTTQRGGSLFGFFVVSVSVAHSAVRRALGVREAVWSGG